MEEAFQTGAYMRDNKGYKGMREVMKKFLATRTKTRTKQKDSLWEPPFNMKATPTSQLPRIRSTSKYSFLFGLIGNNCRGLLPAL